MSALTYILHCLGQGLGRWLEADREGVLAVTLEDGRRAGRGWSAGCLLHEGERDRSRSSTKDQGSSIVPIQR